MRLNTSADLQVCAEVVIFNYFQEKVKNDLPESEIFPAFEI